MPGLGLLSYKHYNRPGYRDQYDICIVSDLMLCVKILPWKYSSRLNGHWVV